MAHDLFQSDNSGPPPPYIAAVCDPRYSSSVDSEKTTRLALEDRISHLFRKVWLGLYEVDQGTNRCESDDVEGPTQISRLRALAKGAGLTSFSMFLDSEFDAPGSSLSQPANHGISSLQIFDCTSISNLEFAVKILKAYEQEIAVLDGLYSILQENQLGLHQSRSPDEIITRETECFDLFGGMIKRISEQDGRMEALQQVICEEAQIFRQTGHEPVGHYVYKKVVRGQPDTILGLGAVHFD